MQHPREHRTPASKSREFAVERRLFVRSVPAVGKERRELIEPEVGQLVSFRVSLSVCFGKNTSFYPTIIDKSPSHSASRISTAMSAWRHPFGCLRPHLRFSHSFLPSFQYPEHGL